MASSSPQSVPGQTPADWRWLGVLLLGLFILYVIQINHGLPNRDIVWGYDSNPLLPLIAAKKIFVDGWNSGWHTPYPNFHYYVLLLLFTPYMAVQWMLGNLAALRMEGGYPYGLRDFDTIFMHLAIVTRLVSVAMALGTAYWVYRIGRAVHSSRAGLFAAAIVGFSPAIVYYVHVETLDVPMLFWLTAALYCYVRALQTIELRFYVWLAILAAIATATKDYAYGLFVLLPLPLVATLARRSYGSVSPATLLRSAIDRRHLIALAAFAVSFMVAENWWWNFAGFVNHVKLAGGFVPESELIVTTKIGRLDFFSAQRWSDMGQTMPLVLGWAGLVISVAGVVYSTVRERTVAATLVWPALSYYVFTVCQTLPAGVPIERPYMPLGMILAIMGGVLLARLSASRLLASKVLVAATVIAIAVNGIAMDLALVDDPRYQAEKWLKQNVASGSTIEFYGVRSQEPRYNRQWKMVTLNDFPSPSSDVQLTKERVAPEALALRHPEWIIVSQVYSDRYSLSEPVGTGGAIRDFFERLPEGELGYGEASRFRSTISDIFGFPSRLTPGMTVYGRTPKP